MGHNLRRKAADFDRAAEATSEQLESPRAGHTQLSEYVATKLREQIVSGRLKPGQFLRIDAIAKSLDVSMTPVREGLLMLQSESFVRLLPRRGFVVNSFSKQDLLDMFWAQATLGAELTARSVRRMSDEDIQRLHAINVEYEQAISQKDDARIDRLGHSFHRLINLSAQSPRLALLLGTLTRQLPLRFYAQIDGQIGNALEYHRLIQKTFQLRDASTAAALMHQHLIAGGELLVRMLDRQGLWSDGVESTPQQLRLASGDD